jgi:predicted lipoprotein with Yx(FWY)xxD motif
LRSLGSAITAAALACALAAGCGDDEENGGGAGRGGSAGRGGNAGSAGGGTGGASGSGGSAGQDASAGTGGTDAGEDADFPDGSAATAFEVRSAGDLGDIITFGGRTVYFFGGDAPAGTNTHPEAGVPEAGAPPTAPQANCTSNCLRPLYNAEWSVRTGLARRDFSEFTRADSQKQLAYKGWPLYTSDSDTRPGHTNSDGMEKLWHAVATPFYTVVIRRSTVVEAHNDAGAPYSYTYLADGAGMSLYMYWHDKPSDAGLPESGCVGRCIRNWPPTEAGDLKIVSSLSRADFDALTWTPVQPDGGPPRREIDQLVYKGWLMYYWWRDYVPGDTTGHCFNEWSLAEIDGDFITVEECELP